MLVELTDNEIKGLGERRWFRKNWKKLLVIHSSLLTALFTTVAFNSWLKPSYGIYIIYPLALLWFGTYVYHFWVQMSKEGKKLLIELNK